jgi:signal transduction histidine kinase
MARDPEEAKGHLDEIIESVPDSLLAVRDDWRISHMNAGPAQRAGFDRASMIGQELWTTFPNLVGTPFEKTLRRAMLDRTSARVEDLYPSLQRWFAVEIRPLASGGLAIYVRDTTERVEADRRLRQSESMLAEAQRVARLGSWSWDFAAGKLTWSDEHYRLFGLEPGSDVSADWAIDHIHPDDRERLLAMREQVQREPRVFKFNWRGVLPSGEVRHMQSVGHVEVDAAGVSARAFGITQDVTERETLLASERRAREDAEHAARVRDDFLATLSHELRSPLSAILSWADLIRAAPTEHERVERGLEIIARNARTQAQLVGDLLDLSRIASGKLRLDVQRVAVPEIVEAAVDAMRPLAESRGVRLTTLIESITQPVHGDASRLQQVFANLISNAVKFTPEGGHVQVVVSRVNSHLEVAISDDGKGIEPAFLPHVFERFRQADASAAREHGGLGIGLALVKEIVELHGGTVIARSDGLGRGATFAVRLPIAILASTEGELRLHPRVPAALSLLDLKTPRLTGLRVLVVEDEVDSLEVMRQVLTDQQAVVTAVRTADDALAMLDAHTFDAVLSDIGLPRRDGYELISEARQRGHKLPAAAVTAFARSEDRTRALLAGFQAHIAKPLEVAELVATVASLCGRLSL